MNNTISTTTVSSNSSIANLHHEITSKAWSKVFSHFTTSPLKESDSFDLKNPGRVFYANLFKQSTFQTPKTPIQKWIYEVLKVAEGVTPDEERACLALLDPDTLIANLEPINAILLIGTGLQMALEMVKRGPGKDFQSYNTSARLFEDSLNKLVTKYPRLSNQMKLADLAFNSDNVDFAFTVKLAEKAREKQQSKIKKIVLMTLGALFLTASAIGAYKYLTLDPVLLEKGLGEQTNSLKEQQQDNFVSIDLWEPTTPPTPSVMEKVNLTPVTQLKNNHSVRPLDTSGRPVPNSKIGKVAISASLFSALWFVKSKISGVFTKTKSKSLLKEIVPPVVQNEQKQAHQSPEQSAPIESQLILNSGASISTSTALAPTVSVKQAVTALPVTAPPLNLFRAVVDDYFP